MKGSGAIDAESPQDREHVKSKKHNRRRIITNRVSDDPDMTPASMYRFDI